jgi:hypothetical protein
MQDSTGIINAFKQSIALYYANLLRARGCSILKILMEILMEILQRNWWNIMSSECITG